MRTVASKQKEFWEAVRRVDGRGVDHLCPLEISHLNTSSGIFTSIIQWCWKPSINSPNCSKLQKHSSPPTLLNYPYSTLSKLLNSKWKHTSKGALIWPTFILIDLLVIGLSSNTCIFIVVTAKLWLQKRGKIAINRIHWKSIKTVCFSEEWTKARSNKEFCIIFQENVLRADLNKIKNNMAWRSMSKSYIWETSRKELGMDKEF